MKRSFVIVAVLAIGLMAFGTTHASQINYRLLVNSEVVDWSDVATSAVVGNNKLDVQVMVTDNFDLEANANLGAASMNFNLTENAGDPSDIPGSLEFKDELVFGSPTGNWDSSAPFSAVGYNHIKGIKNVQVLGTGPWFDVLQDFVNVNPSLAAMAAAPGAGVWDTIVSGDFSWDGSPTSLTMTHSASPGLVWDFVPENPVATRARAVVPTSPTVMGTIHFGAVPEPSTLVLVGLSLVGFVASNRSRNQQG